MTNQELLIKANLADQAWAKQAVADTIHGLKFNELLVKRGLWDKYIAQMQTELELDAYSCFAIGLKDLYTIAKRLEK
jgi:hypothetical protein